MSRSARNSLVAIAALGGVLVLLPTSSALAAPYGTAGCGLGSVLFGDSPGIVQVLAATTNGTFWTQTFGITSGTSNCVNTSGSAATARAFVETNREAISKDIARGSGETLSGLTEVAGCKDAQAVGRTLQREFKTIFPSEKASDIEVGDAVVKTLRQHKDLQCSSLSS